jgi:DNA replication protein DnaC
VIDFKKVDSSCVIAGIPPCHYDSHLYNFDDIYKDLDINFYSCLATLAEDILLMDLKKHPRYLFLCGQAGSGKTKFMVGLYRALVHKIGYSQGDGAVFSTSASLSQEMISLFKEGLTVRTGLAGYLQNKWIFLDDFTANDRIFKEDSLELTILKDILIDRYEKGYTLVTSCNLSPEELNKRFSFTFGDYLMSRLSEGRVVHFPPVDFRRKGMPVSLK